MGGRVVILTILCLDSSGNQYYDEKAEKKQKWLCTIHASKSPDDKSNMSPLILLSHISLLTLLCFFAAADAVVNYLHHNCTSNTTFNSNDAYRFNLNTLLYSLTSATAEFYNTTAGNTDAAYGLFMCRGDVPNQLCRECVSNATNRLTSDSECLRNQGGVIWYDECLVRFSDRSFFSALDVRPKFVMQNDSRGSNDEESLNRVVAKTMNDTVVEAVRSGPQGTKKFAMREEKLSESEWVYSVAQCTPDLSEQDCNTCLRDVVGDIFGCCLGKQGGRVLYPSCNIRYELYPFYNAQPQPPSPSSSVIPIKAAYPTYLYHNCSIHKNFTANSPFQLDRTTLLSSLASNATGNTEFYNTTADTAYGLFMCRGDVNRTDCHQCVVDATQRISAECRSSKEAIIWYDECMLRYSNRSFFSTFDTRPRLGLLMTSNVSDQEGFIQLLAKSLIDVVSEAIKARPVGTKNFGTKEANISGFESLYSLAQCTPDLSSEDCDRCLRILIGDITWCCLGKQGGRVLYPSCNIRYELYPFYNAQPQPPDVVVEPPSPSSSVISIKAADPTYLYHNCSTHKNFTAKSPFESDRTNLFSSLASNAGNTTFYNTTVAAAYGLFMCRGDVTLQDCRQCVVDASWQLIAKCPFSMEAIIWYDECTLRYSYRSFFSTVDTRPRGALLDKTFVSDQEGFDKLLAKTLNDVVNEAIKSRAGGTKNFGTIQANMSGFQTALYSVAQCTPDLSSEAWKQWRDEKLSEILDSNIREVGSYDEVIKCIRIGLLCVQENPKARPSMATVVSYLSNDSIQLPNPQEPAFFMHGRMELTIGKKESTSSDQYTNNPCSVNEMSITKFFPR
ncbi:Cysteine-rich receptor-like protein kinase 25 [Senna tora]|uniref:Cysteine-rich receptor-like protein kinase 25 n=1 Tax=Senna tora TaxID=362788 RepID=A0A835CGG1_9FABA|nr:Cysteine-rich receptor-like protein kinase 25 [Senna tora]